MVAGAVVSVSARLPFFTRLWCLRCGTYWWSDSSKRTTCPGCEANGYRRFQNADGTWCTEMAVAAVVSP